MFGVQRMASAFVRWLSTDALLVDLSCVLIFMCKVKTYKRITVPADCEIHSVNPGLNARNVDPAEIHRLVKDVFGLKPVE